MAYNPNLPAGQAASSASAPVVLSSDQSAIPMLGPNNLILATPTANSLAALNATVQYQVEAGGNYILSLVNGPAAVAQFVGTITFQYSTNGGGAWSSLTVSPIAQPSSSANTSTSTTVGLFSILVPGAVGAAESVLIRANMTAYTSGTVYFFVSPQSPNSKVLLPWTYTVTTGNTLAGPFPADAFSELAIQISAITTTVLTVQGTDDPTLATWATVPVISTTTQAAAAGTIAAVNTFRAMINGYKWVRIQCTTTGTVLSVQGITGTMSQQVLLTSFGNDVGVTVNSGTLTTVSTVTTCSTVTSLSQIAASVPLMNIANGSTNKALGVTLSTATTNADYSAQAWAAASGSGATIAPAIGDGLSCSFLVSLTAWTAGSSTGLYVYLQESPDNGTTWMDIYGCEPFTAVGVARIPAIPIGGRRRMRWVNRAGAATTATVTVTAMALPGVFPIFRQFFDWGTTGTAANSNLITGAAATTSTSTITSTLNTTGQTTAAYPVDGCSLITVKSLVTGGTATTAPVLTVLWSDDYVNFYTSATTITLPVVAGMSSTNIPVGTLAKYVQLKLTTAQSGGTAIALSYISIIARQ